MVTQQQWDRIRLGREERNIMSEDSVNSARLTTSIESNKVVGNNPIIQDDLGDISTEHESRENEESSSIPKELEPLVGENMEGGAEKEDSLSKSTSCWNCKYNWRYFLPVTCCCKRYIIFVYLSFLLCSSCLLQKQRET